MRDGVRTIGIVLVVLLVAGTGAVTGAFILRNNAWVVLSVPALRLSWPWALYSVPYDVQLGWLLLGTFAAGAATVTLVVVVPMVLRRAIERRRAQRVVTELEAELTELRNLPITQPAPFEDLSEDRVPAGKGFLSVSGEGEDGDEDAVYGDSSVGR